MHVVIHHQRECATATEANAPHITPLLVTSALIAALGGLLFGFDTAVIAGTTHSLIRSFNLTPATLGITVSSALWGTIVGVLLAGYAGERYGRRDSLRIMAVLYLISAAGCSAAWNWQFLIVARIVGGLGIGGSSVLGPMYIAELSPARFRGRMVGLFQFNIVMGILLAYLSNYVISLQHLQASEWRWQLAVPVIPALGFLLLLFTIPRSPRWLVEQGQDSEACLVLTRIGEPEPEVEVKRIAESIDIEHRFASERLFSRAHRLPIFLAITIAAFSQLSGINAVLYYINDIFSSAGLETVSGGVETVIIGATNLIFTTLAMITIDRFGRRALLLIGSAGMFVTLLGTALIFHTNEHQNLLVWLLVAYCASFSFSIGTVLWVYISEVFPNGVRAKGQSLGSLVHWVMNAIVSACFPIFAARSSALPFVFFAAMTAVQFVVVLLIYPETKNISLEEMRL